MIERRRLMVSGKKPIDPNGHKWVDFGLPSGKVWAKYSVGGYAGYGGNTYKFGTNDNNVTYYNGLAPLPLSHDTANVVMGGDWQMSMYDDWVELRTYCEVKSVSDNIAAIGRKDDSTSKLIYMQCSEYWNGFSGGSTTNAAFGGISSTSINPAAYYGSRSNLRYVHGILKRAPEQPTVALLHFDDRYNPTNDECDNTWTLSGTPSTNTDSKFGSRCWNQSNAANMVLNTGLPYQDFTIEGWVKPTGTSNYYNWRRIFQVLGSGLFIAMANAGGTNDYMYWKPNNTDIYIKQSVMSRNTWHHVAITYNNETSKAKLFIDGQLQGTEQSVAWSGSRPSAMTIQLKDDNTSYGTACMLDEFRFSKGVLYTNNFTPPTEPFSV